MKPPFDPAMSDGCSVPPLLQRLVPTLKRQCERADVRAACLRHDEAYYYGGSELDRMNADQALYRMLCPLIGDVWALEWYAAVRAGGYPHWGKCRTWDGRVMWQEAGVEAP